MAKDSDIFPRKYRVRKGWRGLSVLQVLVDSPSFSGGQVDSSTRIATWCDVPFDRAPRALRSEVVD